MLLLDTNILVKIANDSLPARVRRFIEKRQELLVSIVTPWEIAIHPELQRRGFSNDHVEKLILQLGAKLLPVTMDHTGLLATLPPHHSDPFDRMIIAQAIEARCPIVSSDRRFPLYESAGLQVVWD